MKLLKKIFLIIVTFLITISLSTLFIGCPSRSTEEIIEKTIEEVTTTEETTKVVEQEEEVKYSELNFTKVKRLKKEFGDHLIKATTSIIEQDGPEYAAQMSAIDEILDELKLAKKIENLGGLEELYDLFIEDIKTTVDMLIAESIGDKEEYEELNKKVMELDEKFLNEYHRIEDKLK